MKKNKSKLIKAKAKKILTRLYNNLNFPNSVFVSKYVSRDWSSTIFNKFISKLSVGAKGNILKS